MPQDSIPHTTGTQPPALALPPQACDAHIHVYDARFPSIGDPARVLAHATASDYRRLQARLGTARTVVVTPTVYGTDNRVTLDAIRQLGHAQTRGIGVLHPEVDDATLHALNAGGIRGIRFTLFDPATAVTRFDMVEPLARRIAPLGWHVQLHWRADQIVAHAALIERLPCPIVFDHMARLPHPQGEAHPAFAIVARLLDAGRAWVKLSAPYLDGGTPEDDSRARVVEALCRHAPERLVWGSDWPHPTETKATPDDAALLDRFGAWVPGAALRQRVWVDNPAALYGF
ncbi:putative metal-dependent hydrolase of the TIM-barrel fold protein [Variovorax sp. SRS16]|uniref:amidohydrolase family protein n=1 Tax=Variovorax sp. SRS16 TaxID=282217 RepID=UPI001317EE87|nr:amidohydrolase family protein [Variovorax sp. SRS16]VTU24572.1 putative metal-dependent hydrolase of the TIM-barrel fold protein [Variovorax sp. SRS16]